MLFIPVYIHKYFTKKILLLVLIIIRRQRGRREALAKAFHDRLRIRSRDLRQASNLTTNCSLQHSSTWSASWCFWFSSLALWCRSNFLSFVELFCKRRYHTTRSKSLETTFSWSTTVRFDRNSGRWFYLWFRYFFL